jgi:hypothetical protein
MTTIQIPEPETDLPVIADHVALLDVLDAAKLLIAMNNCNYDRDQMRRSGGFQGLEEAVGRVETLRQARGGPVTCSDAVQQAFRDWNEHRAYIKRGNYRVKTAGSQNGPIASWNKEVKRLFASCAEFHAAAQANKSSDRETL